jgi:hypothetical protein
LVILFVALVHIDIHNEINLCRGIVFASGFILAIFLNFTADMNLDMFATVHSPIVMAVIGWFVAGSGLFHWVFTVGTKGCAPDYMLAQAKDFFGNLGGFLAGVLIFAAHKFSSNSDCLVW